MTSNRVIQGYTFRGIQVLAEQFQELYVKGDYIVGNNPIGGGVTFRQTAPDLPFPLTEEAQVILCFITSFLLIDFDPQQKKLENEWVEIIKKINEKLRVVTKICFRLEIAFIPKYELSQ